MSWTLAQRAEQMNPSVIREILKISAKPGIVSFAGGWPSALTFPVDAFAEASAKVLREDGGSALQYMASEGYLPLREHIAQSLPWAVDPADVLITTGSQQALDLLGKLLIDEGSKVLVETPTYLGALQSFSPMLPDIVSVGGDDDGLQVDDLERKAAGARLLYALPNFQNPTGRTMSAARREAVVQSAARLGVPIIEDNPYGELWFDMPPGAPLTASNPEGCVYMGSFSKILSPGMRVGYLVAPKSIYPKLLHAKQAADLHTPNLNQRMVYEVIKDGFLDQHIPRIRELYKAQRDVMLKALRREMDGLDVQWNTPQGGMFLWVRLPEGMSAVELLPKAVDAGVAFVAGSPFYAGMPDVRSLRLSFVTATAEQIEIGIAALASTIRRALDH